MGRLEGLPLVALPPLPTLTDLPGYIRRLEYNEATSLALLAVGVLSVLFVRYIRSPYRKLPPGPRGLPIIGNLLQLRGQPQWLTFTEWRQRYGDLVYLNVAGQHIVVLNSQKVAVDLLDRRASKYSDRPRSIVAAEILTGGLFFVFTRYSEVWRRMRKGAHQGLHKGVAPNYEPIQMAEGIRVACDIIAKPEHWEAHFRRSAASTVMSVVYDKPPILEEGDTAVKAINDMVARLTRAALPGAHLVEFFPVMKYIPSSLAKWKREAEQWYKHDSQMLLDLFNGVRDRVSEGEDRPSLCATLIHDSEKNNLSGEENAWLAGTMHGAGSETTAGVMSWWMLAMVAHPEVQARAQAELDAVVGRSRIPTFADRAHLPYINALVKEALRQRPVDPLGMPHVVTEDDWYDGMFIPKGTVCIANVWHLNRDPSIYGPDAHEFKPERHMEKNAERIGDGSADLKEEGHFTYGFGRRICVGRHVANSSLFIDMAVILWAMRILPATDAKGKAIPVDLEGCVDGGLVVGPPPFECKIVPRFPEAAAILEEERELLGQ